MATAGPRRARCPCQPDPCCYPAATNRSAHAQAQPRSSCDAWPWALSVCGPSLPPFRWPCGSTPAAAGCAPAKPGFGMFLAQHLLPGVRSAVWVGEWSLPADQEGSGRSSWARPWGMKPTSSIASTFSGRSMTASLNAFRNWVTCRQPGYCCTTAQRPGPTTSPRVLTEEYANRHDDAVAACLASIPDLRKAHLPGQTCARRSSRGDIVA